MNDWIPEEKEVDYTAKCWCCEKEHAIERLNYGLCPKCAANIDRKRRVLAEK